MPHRQGCLSLWKRPQHPPLLFFHTDAADTRNVITGVKYGNCGNYVSASPHIAAVDRCARQQHTGFMSHRKSKAKASTGRINRLNTTAVIMCRQVHP